MTEFTPNLYLRSLGNYELPHAFNSETVTRLDVASATRLVSITTNTPPESPSIQDAYYVELGAGSTAWEGLSEQIVYWTGGAWESFPARQGFTAFIISDGVQKTYQNGDWVEFNESLVITKTFNQIYPKGQHIGVGIATYRESLGGAIITDKAAVRPMEAADRLNIALTAGTADVYEQMDGGYPLYRYRGNETLTGYPDSAMPRLLKVTVQIAGNTSLLRATPRIGIYQANADSGLARNIDTWGGVEADLDEQIPHFTPGGFNEPFDPHGDQLISLAGVSEVPSGTDPDYDYVHEVTWEGNLEQSAGYVVLNFEPSGTFGYGPSYTSGPVAANMVVTLETTNNY